MSKSNAKKLATIRAIRGIDRREHFSNGGSLHDWRGGLHTVQKDKKKEKSRKACRGRYRDD